MHRSQSTLKVGDTAVETTSFVSIEESVEDVLLLDEAVDDVLLLEEVEVVDALLLEDEDVVFPPHPTKAVDNTAQIAITKNTLFIIFPPNTKICHIVAYFGEKRKIYIIITLLKERIAVHLPLFPLYIRSVHNVFQIHTPIFLTSDSKIHYPNSQAILWLYSTKYQYL